MLAGWAAGPCFTPLQVKGEDIQKWTSKCKNASDRLESLSHHQKVFILRQPFSPKAQPLLGSSEKYVETPGTGFPILACRPRPLFRDLWVKKKMMGRKACPTQSIHSPSGTAFIAQLANIYCCFQCSMGLNFRPCHVSWLAVRLMYMPTNRATKIAR